MKCPYCQSELRDDAQFCRNCGGRVESDAEDVTLVHNPSATPARAATTIATTADPLIGKILDNRYQLTGHVGHGGMGTVYRARRLTLGDDVAVKVLHKQFVAQEQMLERFRREARAAAMLHHPNTVAIYDFGDAAKEAEDGRVENDVPAYIVMELLQGETLGAVLRREKSLAPRRAVRILRQACAGVGAAHARGIVHRDLKPDNIIVLPADADHGALHEDGDGEAGENVKVVDFGIAKLRDMTGEALGDQNLTHVGTLLGTPSYMSPEQCRGEHLDARSDVYSLGAIAYELLAGRPPFTAPTANGVIAKHLIEPVAPLAPARAYTSPDDGELVRRLDGVVRRALDKQPDNRQADATAFARELTAALRAPKGDSLGNRGVSSPMEFSGVPVPVQPSPPAAVEESSVEFIESPPPKSSRIGTFVGLALVAIIAASATALAWMLYAGSQSSTTANRNLNRNAAQRPHPTPTATVRQTPVPTPSVQPADANINGVINAQPSASVSPSPAVSPGVGFEPQRAADEIKTTLDGWVETTQQGDLEDHIEFYAPELEAYYRRGRTDRETVRADRRQAFERFSDIEVRLSNMRVQFDQTGRAATVTFDKRWLFEGDGISRGAVQQALNMRKVGDRWLIVGERDLRIYPDGETP